MASERKRARRRAWRARVASRTAKRSPVSDPFGPQARTRLDRARVQSIKDPLREREAAAVYWRVFVMIDCWRAFELMRRALLMTRGGL